MAQVFGLIFLALFVFFTFFKEDSPPRDPCTDKFGAYFAGQEFVKRKLKSPSSADFPHTGDKDVYITIMDECEFHIRGYVDANNAFGVKVRTNYSMLIEYSRANRSWHLTSSSL